MEYIVTAQEMKRYDAATITKIGIPALVLMERAALSVLQEVEKLQHQGIHIHSSRSSQSDRVVPHEEDRAGRILIMAGIGNNGADGLALARLLSERGYEVEVVCCEEDEGENKASVEWKTQRAILNKYSVKIGRRPRYQEYNVLIDALFGVGLSRDIGGEYAQLICCFNDCAGYKIALDVPSGIHSDSGEIMGCAAKVNMTVTFAFAKRGLFFRHGIGYAGEIKVKDIGIGAVSFGDRPPGMFRYVERPEMLLPVRDRCGNKGSFGKVLLAAGSMNMAGAALLAGKSAYRIGAGMVKIITAIENRSILQVGLPEALLGTEDDLREGLTWATVVAVGPGMGKTVQAARILQTVLEKSRLPLVIDADGLNLLAEDSKLRQMVQIQGTEGREIILTPHMGELSNLTGIKIAELKKRPVEYVSRLAEQLQCIVVCKDARTLVLRPSKQREGTPLEEVHSNSEGKSLPVCRVKTYLNSKSLPNIFLNTLGNSGMATAGSGDVLSGMIVGLLAQGMDAYQAACVGVYLHGLAGDVAAMQGEHRLMAGDIMDHIGEG